MYQQIVHVHFLVSGCLSKQRKIVVKVKLKLAILVEVLDQRHIHITCTSVFHDVYTCRLRASSPSSLFKPSLHSVHS